MTLSVDIGHRLGTFELDVRFESAGRLTALFGPSGSGKTSVVNAIAGLLRPREGGISLAGTTFLDAGRRIFMPPHRRRIGYVFQDARLFPHMSVRANLGYGRRFTPKAEHYADFEGIVALLGIGHLLDRRPAALSGGEKQRVAIGRALIASPRLILMDEPLASLDEARRQEIIPFIERLRDEMEIPIVYVSHALGEVARLATDVVMIADGRVTAAGPTAEILRRLDLLPPDERGEGGAVIDAVLRMKDDGFGLSLLKCAAGELRVPRIDAPIGSPVRVRIRARDVMIATERPQGISALNVLPGTVLGLQEQGSVVDVTVDCGGAPILARITLRSAHMLGLALGRPVFAVLKTVTFDHANLAGVGGKASP